MKATVTSLLCSQLGLDSELEECFRNCYRNKIEPGQ